MAGETNDRLQAMVERKKAVDRAAYVKAVAEYEAHQHRPTHQEEDVETWGLFASALQRNAAAWNSVLVDDGLAIHVEERKLAPADVAHFEIHLFKDGRHAHKALDVHVDGLGTVQIRSAGAGMTLQEQTFSFHDEAALHNFDQAIVAFLSGALRG